MKKIAFVFTASLVLAGCEPMEQAEREDMLSTELEVAARQKDPFQAFQTVQAVKSKLCESRNCDGNRLWVKAGEDEVKYLTAAIKQGNPKAFSILYSPVYGNSASSIDQVKKQPESASKFLAYAERLPGATPDEGMLLSHAGVLVMMGKHAVRDTTRAANLFARAWAAGDSDAATLASRLYISNNDLRNAYLWSLRCTGKCERDAQADLNTLQEGLSPEAIKQAQQAAQDASVIELTTGG